MSYTKQQLIVAAFEEIGLAQYVFDLEPDLLQFALKRLDALIATWDAKGIYLGYPLPSSPENSLLSDESNIPDLANEAVILNLAIRLAPSRGKTVPRETKVAASQAYKTVLSLFSKPPEMQLPKQTPLGQGTKYWRSTGNPFVQVNEQPLDVVNQDTAGTINYN